MADDLIRRVLWMRSSAKLFRRQGKALSGIFLAVLMLSSSAFPSLSYSDDFIASTLGDYGNITVMEVSGNYDAKNADGSSNSGPRKTIAKEFFRLHKDEYDFLVIFSNFNFKMPESKAAAFYSQIKNDTQGIGLQPFDNSANFGSSGKLQGTIDMGDIANLSMDPLDPKFDFTLDTISHEMMHRWAAYVKFRKPDGSISTDLLGKDGSHWSFLLSTDASLMYGNTWQDNGNGTFTSVKARKYYSPLDLYLMGFIGKTQVPPMLLIENPSIDPARSSETGVTIPGTPRYITIDDIIAAEGERVPGPADSQKSFKTAFIFITSPGTFTGSELYGMERVRSGWMTRYSILTDGKGLVQVVPSPIGDIPGNPGVPPPPPPSPAPAGMDAGVAWLMSNQKSDGSWQNMAQTAVRDTEEGALTLKDFAAAQTNYANGLQWLGGASSMNVDDLSRKITALSASGQEVQALVSELISRRNTDGGWGSNGIYRSTLTDTAFALRALIGIQNADQNVVSKAVEYLISRQNSDGGWGFYQEDSSNVLMTATVSGVLQKLTGTLSIASAIEKAKNYILSHQNSDGGFGSSPSTVYETALAYMALSKLTTDGTVLGNALYYLISEQSAEGSWLGDPYSTALAVKALYLAKDLPSIPPRPATSIVTGKVIDGTTNQPLSKVTVVLVSDATVKAVTDVSGKFTLSKVPAGGQNISFSLSGYMTTTIPVTSLAGSIKDIGTSSLYPMSTAGIIRGSVTDVSNGEPLANAVIEVKGSFTGTVSTGADGSFVIGNVIPGALTLTASKEGYIPVSNTGTISPGEVLFFYPQLMPLSTQPATGSATGKVVDAVTRQPLSGVSVTLQDDASISALTDSAGNFTMTNIPMGAQSFIFSYAGYASATVSVAIIAGSVADLGTVPLSSNVTPGTIKGVVKDAATGQPLNGVSVALQSNPNRKTMTDPTGSYTLSDIPPGLQKITYSLSGYSDMSATVNIPAGFILDLGVLPLTSNPSVGVMKGTVTDADNGQPLEGVTIAVAGAFTGSTATGTDGGFLIGNITPGFITFTASKPGYYSLNGSLTVTAGEVSFFDFQMTPLPKPGALRGKVFDAAAKTPIKGAVVSLSGGSQTTTDEQGVFTISGVVPGTHQVNISFFGYLSQKYQIIIMGGSTTDMQTIFLSPTPTSTTVTGRVTDASTGNPISNADVVIVGTTKAAKTDSSGSYTLSGINLLEFNLKAAAAGYDTRFNNVHTEAYGHYAIDFGLNRSQASNIEIIALGTDKASYSAKNTVTITASIKNTGAAPVDVIIAAHVMDQANNLLAVISYGAAPDVTLNPNSPEAISLQWDTSIYPPGNYHVILSVVDSGKGILLADGYRTFGIASTIAIDGVVPLITPKFLNIGSRETVAVSATVTNSSNVDVPLSAEYEVKAPNGNLMHGGTVDFTIAPSEPLKTIELGRFTYTFAASGQYPVTVKIRSGGSVILENSYAIYVSPSIRIEASKTLTPTTVVPDGDKRIRIDIRLQGVEVNQ